MFTITRRFCLLATGLLAISACAGEQLSAPAAKMAIGDAAAHLKIGGPKKKKTLELATGVSRNVPLGDHVTVSAMIGTGGGKISIPAAGMTLTIQPGSLAATTLITVTARKGALLAYDFKPHGLIFAKPLLFQQQLVGTNVNAITALTLTLGYYTDPALLTSTGGTISEAIAGTVGQGVFASTIPHFSGYMVASGRRPMTSSDIVE